MRRLQCSSCWVRYGLLARDYSIEYFPKGNYIRVFMYRAHGFSIGRSCIYRSGALSNKKGCMRHRKRLTSGAGLSMEAKTEEGTKT